MNKNSIAALFAASFAASAWQVSGAQEVPPPLDQAYPGTITLKVDATNVDQKIFQVHESIPVKAGRLTLLYPQWLPGNHSPTGPLAQLAGLVLSGNHHTLEWKRDAVNMYAFHVEVPADVTALEADFQFVSPVEASQGRITATTEIVGVQWNTVLLYPAGYYARDIRFSASVMLPPDWKFGTALELTEQAGAEARFKETSLNELVDSPLFAGKYFQRFDLDPGANVPVFLNVVADRADNLTVKPEQIDAHRALVQQAYKLYGSHHYDHYDFLLALSDEFSGIGLEHHQSSENGVKSSYFTQWDRNAAVRSILPHEFTHSWDGKFRRPADLWTPNFNVPMQDSLLWVYEGQTQYWGNVLASRSGLVSLEQERDALAMTVAAYDQHVGRSWRALQDTTNDPVINQRRPLGWISWQRTEDYYSEGELVWLDVDTKIRELSGDQRSLNDFARRFFGVENGNHVTLTYTFDDVVKSLNAVQAFDWASFLRTRLDAHGAGAPLDGLKRSGWKLVYAEQPTDYFKSAEEYRHTSDFSYSLGFSVDSSPDKEKRLTNVIWDSPAFKNGMTAGATLLAVNGRAYKPELLKAAISAAKSGKDAIELLLKKDDRYRTVRIDYHEGLKYPRLERIDGTPDRLQAILQPMK